MTLKDSDLRRLKDAVKKVGALKPNQYIGILGDKTRVVLTGIPGIVYVTTFGGQVNQVLNRRVPNVAGSVVVVGKDEYSANRIEVLYEINVTGSTTDGTALGMNGIVPGHNASHVYPNYDTVYVRDAQYLPLNVLPVGELTVQVYPGAVAKTNSYGWVFCEGGQLDLTAYRPDDAVSGGGVRWVLIQVEDDGTISVTNGAIQDSRAALTAAFIPDPTATPICAIILDSEYDDLYRNNYRNDFYDLRSDRKGQIIPYEAADLNDWGCIEPLTLGDAADQLAARVTALEALGGGWDGDILDVDPNSGADIGEDLVTADKFIVYNASGTTMAWSTIYRLANFVQNSIFDMGTFSDGQIPVYNFDDNNFISSNSTIADLGDVRTQLSPVTADNLVKYFDTSGDYINDSGIATADVVERAATPVTSGNIPEYNDTSGNILADSGIASADVDSLVDDSILTDLHFHAAFPTEVSITGTTTLDSTAFGKIHVCSGTTSDYTVTLPAASGNAGKWIAFRMSGALTKLVTLDGNASETIDGDTTRIMWSEESCKIMCDGSNWAKVSGKSIPMLGSQRASTSQGSIATATVTKLTLGTSSVDNTGLMVDTANSRVYARRAGYWRVYGIMAFAALSGAATNVQARLHLDGDTTNSITAQVAAAISGEVAFREADLPFYSLTKDQYFELYCYHNTGSNESSLDNASFHGTLYLQEIPAW